MLEPSTTDRTLSSIGNGLYSIVVGAADNRATNFSSTNFTPLNSSSAGPSRNEDIPDTEQKPEVCAPGRVQAASYNPILKSPDPVRDGAGTSIAAPLVTAVVAVLMQRARANRKLLTGKKIRKWLLETLEDTGNPYNPQTGYGLMDALALLEKAES